jgi:hypothetical protein
VGRGGRAARDPGQSRVDRHHCDADPPRTLAPARADGVVSALLLQPGERSVRARYAPSDARAGLLLGGIGLLGVLALLCWPERPRLPETRDTRVRPPAAEPR